MRVDVAATAVAAVAATEMVEAVAARDRAETQTATVAAAAQTGVMTAAWTAVGNSSHRPTVPMHTQRALLKAWAVDADPARDSLQVTPTNPVPRALRPANPTRCAPVSI